jgi:hypothetical protein
MRITIALLFIACMLGGCHESSEPTGLESISRGLEEAWPHATHDLRLTVTKIPGREAFHCRLTNTSAYPIIVNSSRLPWVTPGFFQVTAVGATGKVPRQNPLIIVGSAVPRPVSIAPGESREGDAEFKYVRFPESSRNEDFLVLWAYRLEIDPGGSAFLSGVVFLPRATGGG